MDVDVVTEIEIARPRNEVAAYATDPGNATTWYANIVRVAHDGTGPLRVGSRMVFEARFLGRPLVYTYEVAELVPGQRLVMRTTEGPLRLETTYTWADAPGGGTRMTLRNRGGPAGAPGALAPVAAAAVRRATGKDLRRLKAVLEGDRA